MRRTAIRVLQHKTHSKNPIIYMSECLFCLKRFPSDFVSGNNYVVPRSIIVFLFPTQQPCRAYPQRSHETDRFLFLTRHSVVHLKLPESRMTSH